MKIQTLGVLLMIVSALWIGVEAGYRIGRNAKQDAFDRAYDIAKKVGYRNGFDACQEQF